MRFDCVDRGALQERGVASPSTPEDPGAVFYASVGTAVPGHRVCIKDPLSGEPMPARHTGEVVVSGPSITPGYFDELTRGVPARQELRTGDLGYVADGELFLVDRLKDVLIVAGRNFAPADIERVVGAVPGVRKGGVIAFSTPGSRGTEVLCLMVCTAPKYRKPRATVCSGIQRALFDCFGLTAESIFVVRPADLPRTSSGKLKRAECRELLQSGKLQATLNV
jgi:acyl-CoA synthetase (AMP-forming)/AMP-acid ligase II